MTWAARPAMPAFHIPTATELATILDQIEALSNCDGINLASAVDSTTSATYVNMAATSSFAFTKKLAATRLRIDMHVTWYNVTNSSVAKFGVAIGGTDYDVCELQQELSAAAAEKQASGVRYISGLAAGAYTVQGRWLRVSGAGTPSRATTDWISISAQECG